MIKYPNIDPVLIKLGFFEIRWYGLTYILSILLAILITYKYSQKKLKKLLTYDQLSSLLTWTVLGVILGGRIGYILFYNFSYYFTAPLQILYIWNGGMSYHGGFIGVMLSMILWTRLNAIRTWSFFDLIGLSAPFAIFLGRIANFINGELYGRVTTVPWGMVFPNGGDLPRHPSQIYEALGEGLFLGIFLVLCEKYLKLKEGHLVILYVIGYGVVRFVLEFFREPDQHLGTIITFLTMGQLLSLAMVALGIGAFIYRSKTTKA